MVNPMPEKSLRDRIQDAAAERDAEGICVNPSLESIHDAALGTPMEKTRKGRESLVKSAANEASATAGAVRAVSGRWFGDALADNAPQSPMGKAADSPAVGILGDLNRLLKAFRDAEGRDPTEDDVEYWKAFAHIIREPLGGNE